MKSKISKAILIGICAILMSAGSASAWLLTHVHPVGYSNRSTHFDNTYTGNYYTKGIGPTRGTVTTWAIRSGVNYGMMNNSDGRIRCRCIYL